MSLKRVMTIALVGAALSANAYASEEILEKKSSSLSVLKEAKQAVRKGKDGGSVEDSKAGYEAALKVIQLLPADVIEGNNSYYKLFQAKAKCLKKVSKTKEGIPYLEAANRFIEEKADVFARLEKLATEEKAAMDQVSVKYRSEVLMLNVVEKAVEESKAMSRFTFGKKNVRTGRRSEDKALMVHAFEAFKDAVLAAPAEMKTGHYPFFKLQGAVKKSLSKLEKYGKDAADQYKEAKEFYDKNSEQFEILEKYAKAELKSMKDAGAAYRGN